MDAFGLVARNHHAHLGCNSLAYLFKHLIHSNYTSFRHLSKYLVKSCLVK
jgi:hypothetical protein